MLVGSSRRAATLRRRHDSSNRQLNVDDGAFVRHRSNVHRGGPPVLVLEPPLKIANADASLDASSKGVCAGASAGVFNRQMQRAGAATGGVVETRAHDDLSS